MKRLATGTLALALAALVAGSARAQQPAPAAGQDTRPTIAVLDYDIGLALGQDREDYEALRRGLASMVLGELATNANIRVVERAQLQQILQEQNLGRDARLDNNALVRVGRLLGAKYMITGTFYDNRGDIRVNSRIFDTETSEIVRASEVRGRWNSLFDVVPQLADQIIRDASLRPWTPQQRAEVRTANPAPPTAAVMAYSRAVLYADRGDTQRAVEQYRRALDTFPQYTQARSDCNRLQANACGS